MAQDMEEEELGLSNTPVSIPFPELANLPNDVSLSCSWGIGSELAVYPCKWSKKKGRRKKEASVVRLLQWNCMDISSFKMSAEAHLVFGELTRQAKEFAQTQEQIPMNVLLGMSKNYRALLKGVVVDEEVRDELDLQLYLQAEDLWHFFEIFFLQGGGAAVSHHLIDWMRSHHSSMEPADEIAVARVPEQHPLYWDTIVRFLVQGRIDEAQEILALHSDASSLEQGAMDWSDAAKANALGVLKVALDTMPRFRVGLSESQFAMDWNQWQEDVRKVVERRQDIIRNDDFVLVFGVLLGNENTLKEITTTWYGLLAAQAMWRWPTLKAVDVKYRAEACVEAVGSPLELGDHILLAILDFDDTLALRLVSQMGFAWVSAHLSDLLWHAGAAQAQLANGVGIREHCLLEYAEVLLGGGAWALAVSYLEQCPVLGKATLETMVDRQPIRSETKALKLIRVCEQRGLEEQARDVAQVFGLSLLRQGRYGAAARWFARAQDAGQLIKIGEQLLEDFFAQGSLNDMESVVDSMGPELANSPRLAFLKVARDYQADLHSHNYEDAAKKLFQLIGSDGTAPKRFWLPLLIEAVPLLESDTIIFRARDTQLLMAALEDVHLSHQRSEHVQGVSENQLQLLRLALTRNLARALVAPGGL